MVKVILSRKNQKNDYHKDGIVARKKINNGYQHAEAVFKTSLRHAKIRVGYRQSSLTSTSAYRNRRTDRTKHKEVMRLMTRKKIMQ
jgi:hypothetical protein